MKNHTSVILAGNLESETIINLEKKITIEQPGGDLLYAAAGYRLWTDDGGLLSRIGENYPVKWIDHLETLGFVTSGIKRIPETIDSRAFYAILNEEENDSDNPIGYFGELGLPFPKPLLGYTNEAKNVPSRIKPGPLTLRPADIPSSYLDASIAYLGPVDYLSHSLLPSQFRMGMVNHLLIKLPRSIMNPSFWYDFPNMVRGINVLICTKKTILNLFLGHNSDLWEIAQIIGNCGVEIVVITCGKEGQIVYDHPGNHRWEIPAFPVKVVDNVHASDSFAGGFLAGFKIHFDPITSVLFGNISASLKLQGDGPFFILDTLPALAQSRLEVLREKVISR